MEDAPTLTTPKPMLWTGRILGWLFCLFMVFDIYLHITMPSFAVEATRKAGFPPGVMPAIGCYEIVGVVLFLIPRTNVLGAICLTAFFGGATATCMSSGQPIVPAIVFAVICWASVTMTNRGFYNLLFKRTTS